MNRSNKLFILTIILFISIFIFSCGCKNNEATSAITVVFDGNGATLIDGEEIQTININSALQPPEYRKAGYAFQGWSIGLDEIVTNTTVFAVWMQSFEVIFDGGGGELEIGQEHQQILYGNSAQAPIYKKPNFQLTWDKQFDAVVSDMTVTAIWIPTYSVVFNGNGGTYLSGKREQTIMQGNSAIAPIFEKEQYTLSWDTSFDNISSNLSVNAVWTLKQYTVTFVGGESELISGDTTQIINHGNSALAPNFQKDGYTLKWDKPFYDIKEDTIITAIWQKEGNTE